MGVAWLGASLRLDTYPLTWAPMYSDLLGFEFQVAVVDRARLRQGLVARRRDGQQERLTAEGLNISPRAFRRIAHERIFGVDSNKRIDSSFRGIATIELLRSHLGLEHEQPVNWEWRVLRSVNRTLGRHPDESQFIVELRFDVEFLRFDRRRLRAWRRVPQQAELVWEDEWNLDDEPR